MSSEEEGELKGLVGTRDQDKRGGKIAASCFACLGSLFCLVGLLGWSGIIGGGGGDREFVLAGQDCRTSLSIEAFEACVAEKRKKLKQAIQNLDEKHKANYDKFERFLLQYDRDYYHKIDTAEFTRRLVIFSGTLDKIAERNAFENPSQANRTIHGVTKYADWTPEEFRTLLGYRPQENQSRRLFGSSSGSAPCTKNWATRSPTIRNQGGCGNCWTFSTAEGLRAKYIQQHGVDPGVLSTQFITDCMYTNKKCKGGVNGCCGGNVASALQWIERQGGIPTQEAYGDVFSYDPESSARRLQVGPVSHAGEGNTYSGNNPTTSYPCKSGIPKAVQLSGRPSQLRSESSMGSYVCGTGSISIAVDASAWQTYKGGVISARSCGSSVDHAVLLIGIDQSQNAWIVQNSWGLDWGIGPDGKAVPTDQYSNCPQLAQSGECNRKTSGGQKVYTVCAASCSQSSSSSGGGYIMVQYGANACGIVTEPVVVPALSSAGGAFSSGGGTPPGQSGGSCNTNTYGTCTMFGCHQSRGPTNCEQGICMCKAGYCAQGGTCVASR